MTSPGLRIFSAVVSGGLAALAFPPWGFACLLPFALAGLVWSVRGCEVRHSFYLGFGYGMVFFGISLLWLKHLFGPAAVSLWAICALYTGLFGPVLTWLKLRLPVMPEWLLAAVAWTGIEYLRSEIMPPQFPMLGLGYALVDAGWVASLASVVGSYGLSFVVVAMAGWLISARPTLRTAIAAIWFAVLMVPTRTVRPENALQIRLVQADSEDEESLFGGSRQAAERRLDLIVWPEYSFVSDPMRQPKLRAKLTALPRETGSHFLFGAKAHENPANAADFRNSALLLDPSGTEVGRHVKVHTVPFIQDGIAGTSVRAIQTQIGRIGVAICFDTDFPDVPRRLVEDGAEVIIAPSNNPREWGPVQAVQQRQMLQIRAIECGRWLAVADVAGGTVVVDPTGTVTNRAPSAEPCVVDAEVSLVQGRTLFVRGGWRFGETTFVGLIVLLVAAASQPRTRRRDQPTAC